MKLSLCNEVLAPWPWRRQCDVAAALGYAGLELAPYTVEPEAPHRLSSRRIKALRKTAADAGVAVSGLHWLLLAPKGLSITAADKARRARTLEVMHGLVELCAELGGDVLVHGSPAQRRLPKGKGAETARQRGIEALSAVAETATKCGVTYCIEPLAPPAANFVTSLAEAAAIVDQVASPGLRTMIDCCAVANTPGEPPVPELIARYLRSGHMAHIQLNDGNRRGPGQGTDDFASILRALRRYRYDGWMAVEPLVYRPDGPTTAAFSAGYIKGLLAGLGGTA